MSIISTDLAPMSQITCKPCALTTIAPRPDAKDAKLETREREDEGS
jgi:hypothetical protein